MSDVTREVVAHVRKTFPKGASIECDFVHTLCDHLEVLELRYAELRAEHSAAMVAGQIQQREIENLRRRAEAAERKCIA